MSESARLPVCGRIPMAWGEFLRLARVIGWKYEYFDGATHIEPRALSVPCAAPVMERAIAPPLPLREPVAADGWDLTKAYIAAFRRTIEFPDLDEESLPKHAVKDVGECLAGKRGDLLPASRIALQRDSVAGAALIVATTDGPCLELLFVRPEWQRRGVATGMVASAMNQLAAEGCARLLSVYSAANTASEAWHRSLGFVEEPDWWLASRRLGYARNRLWLLEEAGDLDPVTAELLRAEVQRRQNELELLGGEENYTRSRAVCYWERRRPLRRHHTETACPPDSCEGKTSGRP